jgi:hypothetical protein
MKQIATIFCVVFSFTAFAQEKVNPTDEFIVSGKVLHETRFTIADLAKFESHKINDVTITNHLGVKKGMATGLTGVLVKDILEKISFDEPNPKNLSEFFLTFIAIDGYKAVFSWNEIFNTETGNHLFIIIEKQGQKISNMEERILLMSTADFKTGRRHIKSLNKIVVGRS